MAATAAARKERLADPSRKTEARTTQLASCVAAPLRPVDVAPTAGIGPSAQIATIAALKSGEKSGASADALLALFLGFCSWASMADATVAMTKATVARLIAARTPKASSGRP